MACETLTMVAENDTNDSKKGVCWSEVGNFVRQTRLIRTIIATIVLFYTISQIVGLGSEDIALIAISQALQGLLQLFYFHLHRAGTANL